MGRFLVTSFPSYLSLKNALVAASCSSKCESIDSLSTVLSTAALISSIWLLFSLGVISSYSSTSDKADFTCAAFSELLFISDILVVASSPHPAPDFEECIASLRSFAEIYPYSCIVLNSLALTPSISAATFSTAASSSHLKSLNKSSVSFTAAFELSTHVSSSAFLPLIQSSISIPENSLVIS